MYRRVLGDIGARFVTYPCHLGSAAKCCLARTKEEPSQVLKHFHGHIRLVFSDSSYVSYLGGFFWLSTRYRQGLQNLLAVGVLKEHAPKRTSLDSRHLSRLVRLATFPTLGSVRSPSNSETASARFN